jgi:4-hydroxy-3-polyprenylbenzoate decarboxylase
VANKDLRDWIAGIEAAGELKLITGAEPKEEIGGIVDIYQRRMGNPDVMFDEVPGFPKGTRVLANILTSVPRINVALGLPPQGSELDLVLWWRSYMKTAPSFKPREVNGGPLSTMSREAPSISKIPPRLARARWRPLHRDRCMVIMKDPDSGWVNSGCYRIQTQGPDVATIMMSPGKHGRIIMTKYHERNQPCPVAVIVGMHPALFMLAGLEIPYGKSEYEAAGGILGEPVEVFNMPRTGAPVPANAEIAFEVDPPGMKSRKDRSANGPAITQAAAGRSLRSASPR